MKISPILEFKGVRIEMNVEEALKIADGGGNGAERVRDEIAMIVRVHREGHFLAPAGLEAMPLLQAPAIPARSKPAPKKKEPRAAGPMRECEWCGKPFKYPGWLRQHKERWCPKKPAGVEIPV